MLFETGMDRRTFIVTAGGAVVSMGLAGCGSDSEPSDTSGGSADGGNNSNKDTSGGTADGGDSDGGDGGNSLEIVEDEFYEEDFSAGVKGTVKNNSDSEIGYVGVQAEFLDSEGTRVGEGMDNTTDLAAGQEWAFDCMATTEASKIDDYKIEVSDSPFS